MTDATPIGTSILSHAANEQLLPALLAQYLSHCRIVAETGNKRRESGFPNLAGFCRFLGCGTTEFDALRESHPVLADRILAILEDEALNLLLSPTLLNAYLRRRLNYNERTVSRRDGGENDLHLIFEHDVLEDGE